MKWRGKFFLFVFCFLSSLIVKAQIGIVDQDAEMKPTLVVLGTYHMGNPGSNVVNPKVADVTTPERQKQMVELVGKLKKFKPTKIAVECDIEDDAKTREIYNKYVSGNYLLSKNETDQIGFRLAKELGHKKVYCVDWGIFPDDPLYNYEKYAAKDAELNSFLKEVYRNLKEETDEEYAKLLPLPIVDQLILVNQPDRMERDHKFYFDLMRIGRGGEYAGANYVSWWYGRNMKILTNIIRITDSMNDRILVVYGAGHNKLLNQLAQESAFYTVESPLKYLKKRNGCQCPEIFDSLAAKIKANYIAYHQTITGKRADEFRQLSASMRRRAEQTPPEKCVLVLQEFIRFFRDGHLFINESPKLSDEDVARLTKNAEQTNLTEKEIRQYLDTNAKRLDPIEGIWYNRDGHRFGIIKDSKRARRDFAAILLSEGVERWQLGQIKAEFRKLPDGSYENVFYSSRHYPLHLAGYLRGEQGGAALRRDGLLLHMPPVTWGKAYPLKEEEKDLIDRTDPRRPTIRTRGTSTVIISVPSHSPEHTEVLNSLVEKFRDRILKSETMIIDIRGNEGGGTRTTNILMPFLATASKRDSRYWLGGRTMVLSSEDNIAYFERIFSQGWIPKNLIPRMRENPGKIVPFSDEETVPDSNKDTDEELSLPRNVAILMDGAVVSAAEAFVINAMKNRKVTLFGENTGGVIDYQSVSIIPISDCPSLGLNLGYPMFAASEHLPKGGVNQTGIPPDVRIGRNVKDPFGFIINYYGQKSIE